MALTPSKNSLGFGYQYIANNKDTAALSTLLTTLMIHHWQLTSRSSHDTSRPASACRWASSSAWPPGAPRPAACAPLPCRRRSWPGGEGSLLSRTPASSTWEYPRCVGGVLTSARGSSYVSIWTCSGRPFTPFCVLKVAIQSFNSGIR